MMRLERRIEEQDRERREILEAVGPSVLPTHQRGSGYDRWELDYMRQHKAEHMPHAAYEASRLMRYVDG
jgi:hypothetical protein